MLTAVVGAGRELAILSPRVSSQGTRVCRVLLVCIILKLFFRLAQAWPKGIQATAGRIACLVPSLLPLLFFFYVLLFIFEKKRESTSGGGAEREGDTESAAGSRP